VKEKLFACGKNKIRAAVDALQYLVLEVHPSPHSPDASRSFTEVGNFRTRECAQSRYAPPLKLPLDSAHLRVTQVYYGRT
jgi:hypothetical protein